jgi:hypothetical protein
MEKRLNEQAEATRAMNKSLNKFIAIMGNQEMSPPLPQSHHDHSAGVTTLQSKTRHFQSL